MSTKTRTVKLFKSAVSDNDCNSIYDVYEFKAFANKNKAIDYDKLYSRDLFSTGLGPSNGNYRKAAKFIENKVAEARDF